MKKILFYMIVSVTFLSLLVSCSKDEDENPVVIATNLTVDKTSLSVDAVSSTASFSVFSNKAWTAKVDSSWVSLDPVSGKADSKTSVTVTIAANSLTISRSAVITITSDDKTATITVSQKGKEVVAGITIPDAKFKQYLVQNFDSNGDGEISTGEAETVTAIDCSGKEITSLDGVESFVNLVSLNCNSNSITKLSLAKNIALTTFSCDSNSMDTLDVTKNAALLTLHCSVNKLGKLDVLQNVLLTDLYCNSNKLAGLNIANNVLLTTFDCSSNVLDTLDISKNIILKTLDCSNNSLKTLDVSKNTVLTTLDCTKNASLQKLYLAENQVIENLSYDSSVTKLEYPEKEKSIVSIPDAKFKAYMVENFDTDGDGEVSEDEVLAVKEINCLRKEISSLTGIEFCTNLETLICSDNSISSIDISKNVKLKKLDCLLNAIATLDISKNTELTYLRCSSCALTSLNVKNNTKLTELSCYENKLKTLDVSSNVLLKILSCQNNTITALDLSSNVALEKLYCQNNLLTTLDLRKNTALNFLNCQKNPSLLTVYLEDGKTIAEKYMDTPPTVIVYPNYLTFKDAAFNTYLLAHFDTDGDGKISSAEAIAIKTIDCSGLGISSLEGIANFTNLTSLTCSVNKLTSVDISSNLSLVTFVCDSNKISELDVSKNTALVTLNCSKNELLTIDVSVNKNLKTLVCNDNALYSLSVDNNTKLETLLCQNNAIAYTMNFSNNTVLKMLNCKNNSKLARLYLNAGQKIETLLKDDNTEIKYLGEDELAIDIADAQFKSYLVKNFDTNNNGEISKTEAKAVTSIACSSLGISSLSGIEYFTNLVTLVCDGNNLTSLPISNNTKLVELNCYSNSLLSIDLSTCPLLKILRCGSNKLTSLNVMRNTALTYIDCKENNLSVLTVRNNSALSKLICTYNPNLATVYAMLTVTVVADSHTNVILPGSGLTIKDPIFENYLLQNFDKDGDGGISTSEAAAVTEIDCSNLGISSLDGISNFTNLYALKCQYNNLVSLDLGANTKLTILYCSDNKLTSLNISSCTVLSWLYCPGNKFVTLDVHNNPSLEVLDCSDNSSLTKLIIKTGQAIKNNIVKDSQTVIEEV